MIEDIKKDAINAQELDAELDEVSGGLRGGLKRDRNEYICNTCKYIYRLNELVDNKCPKCGVTIYNAQRKK